MVGKFAVIIQTGKIQKDRLTIMKLMSIRLLKRYDPK